MTTGRRSGPLGGGATASTTIAVGRRLNWSSRRYSAANCKHGHLAAGGREQQGLRGPSPSNLQESCPGRMAICGCENDGSRLAPTSQLGRCESWASFITEKRAARCGLAPFVSRRAKATAEVVGFRRVKVSEHSAVGGKQRHQARQISANSETGQPVDDVLAGSVTGDN